MDQPQWLAAAWAEFGAREKSGTGNSAAVLGYFRESGHASVTSDGVAWCAAFAGAMLKRAGREASGSLLARSYLDWGQQLSAPRLGALAILARGADSGAGHVGFVVGLAGERLFLIGGNQGDGVTVEAFDVSRVLGYRWPAETPGVGTGATDYFPVALAHVLDMEGGFGDDPYDPGGPTNRGITLADFARAKGVSVTAESRAGLIEELKRIPAALVEDIYRSRYWLPARCDVLAPALALMHFDAAVNHGVGGAIRMLQTAAGVTVDGDIGPQTLAALANRDVMARVERYADVRRERYRSLQTFWRFGNGWLARVDQTRAKAATLAAISSSPPSNPKGPTDMPVITDKSWTQSKTIWGALITAAATVIPVLGPVIGIDLPGDVIRQAGDQTISVFQGLAGLFGTLLTIYGRAKAKQGIAWTK